MSNNAAAEKFGGGFLALAAIWIGVYWMWEPSRSGGVSFADDPRATSDISGLEEPDSVQPEQPVPPVTDVTPDPPQDPTDQPMSDPQTQPPADEQGVIPPEFRDYTVQSGDNFERISRKFFGTGRHAGAIAAANPFVSPTNLRAGQTLRVPVDPGNVQGTAPEGTEPELPEPEFIEYTVVRGDTLSEIAQHFYGSLRYAEVIFNANTDTMTSMNDLSIGQVLRIPSRESVLGEDDQP